MPLQIQTVDVPFGLGIDTKTDAKNVMPGKMIELENAVVDKIGRIAKRPGLVPFTGVNVSDQGTVYADEKAMYLRDRTSGRLSILTSGGQAYTPSTINNNLYAETFWTVSPRLTANVASVNRGISASTPLTIFSSVKTDVCVDTLGRNVLVASADSSGNLKLAMCDFVSRAVFAQSETGITCTSLRILPRPGGNFIVAIGTSTNLRIFDNVGIADWTSASNKADTLILPAASVTIATVNDEHDWDWCISGNNVYIANAVANTITRYVVGTWSPTSATTGTAGAGGGALSVACNGTTVVVFSARQNPSLTSTTLIDATYHNATTLAVTTATATIVSEPNSYSNSQRISSTLDGSGNYVIVLDGVFTQTDSFGSRGFIAVYFYRGNAGVAAFRIGQPIFDCALATKLSSDNIFGCSFTSDGLQNALVYFQVCSSTGTGINAVSVSLVGKILTGQAGQNTQLSSVSEITTSEVRKIISAANTVATEPAIGTSTGFIYNSSFVECWSSYTSPVPSVSVDGRRLFGGGFLHKISSSGVVPAGFLTYPVIYSISTTTTGGTIAAGTYAFIFVLERTDEDGNFIESAPSVASSITTTGATSTISIIVRQQSFFPYYTRDVGVTVYMTAANGSTFYRKVKVAFDPSKPSQAFTVSSPTATNLPVLPYGPNAEAPNTQPDAPIVLAQEGSRVWMVSGSKRNCVQPSKPKLQGFGLAFFPDESRFVDCGSEGIVSLTRQDGKLFAFGSKGCFVASGDGPDSLQQNDTLSDFQRVYGDISAERANATVSTGVGIYVKTPFDIFQIGRDQQSQRLGADVEIYTGLPLRDMKRVDSERRIHFLLGDESSNCTELIYDEDAQQWLLNPRGANGGVTPQMATFQGLNYYYLNNTIFKEDPTTYADNGTYYSMRGVTAWFRPGVVMQGYGAIYTALILGDVFSACTLKVRVRYDFDNTWVDTRTFALTSPGLMQAEVKFSRHRCESFALEISDQQNGAANSQAFNLSGLELKIGVMGGVNRLPASRRF